MIFEKEQKTGSFSERTFLSERYILLRKLLGPHVCFFRKFQLFSLLVPKFGTDKVIDEVFPPKISFDHIVSSFDKHS